MSTEFVTKVHAYYKIQRGDGKPFVRPGSAGTHPLLAAFPLPGDPNVGEEEVTRAGCGQPCQPTGCILWSGPPDEELMQSRRTVATRCSSFTGTGQSPAESSACEGVLRGIYQPMDASETS